MFVEDTQRRLLWLVRDALAAGAVPHNSHSSPNDEKGLGSCTHCTLRRLVDEVDSMQWAEFGMTRPNPWPPTDTAGSAPDRTLNAADFVLSSMATLSGPAPIPDDTKLLRYLTGSKFLDLVLGSHLKFARADSFDDYYEGRATLAEIKASPAYQDFVRKAPKAEAVRLDLYITWALAVGPRYVFVNCWTMATGESNPMWGAYTAGEEVGFAIQTTKGKLVASLAGSETAVVGEVSYGTLASSSTLADYYFRKRRPFEDERELRLILSRRPDTDWVLSRSAGYPHDLGSLKVDLKMLVEKVVAKPGISEWKRNAFEKAMQTVPALAGMRIVKSSIDP